MTLQAGDALLVSLESPDFPALQSVAEENWVFVPRVGSLSPSDLPYPIPSEVSLDP